MKSIPTFVSILLFSLFSLAQEVNSSECFEHFLDGVIVSKLKDKNIAGATLSLVTDGKLHFAKGYGFSDYANRIPVDENQTLFRIGSVSKLFVWIAVMQQVERGNLDLTRNVNDYLTAFKIPNTYREPITLTHLMSHTPGFEDRLIKLFTLDTTELKPLEQVLASNIPMRVRPAGKYAAYSNYGNALAAHLVELASGLDWDEYVETNIFEPLGMFSTTFRQPLPDKYTPFMSKGYQDLRGKLVEKPFELVPLSPAGSVSTTASDMAKFMQMLLNKGHVGEERILEESTFDKIMSPVLQQAPGVNPCLYGFMDISNNRIKIIGHSGDTFWFHAILAIMPEHNMGIFLSFNSQGGQTAYLDVLDSFISQFLAEDKDVKANDEFNSKDLKPFAGEYKMNRYPRSDYLKMISLMTRMNISVEGEKLKSVFNRETAYWASIDDLQFQKEGSTEILAFEQSETGKISHAFIGRMSVFAFERVTFLESIPLQSLVFFGIILLSIIGVVYWPMVYVIRMRYQSKNIAIITLPLNAKVTAWICAFLILLFYVGVMISLGSPEASVYSVPTALKVLLIIPFLVIFINLLVLYHAFALWTVIGTRVRSRIYYSLFFVVNLSAIWQIIFWNFLGWNY